MKKFNQQKAEKFFKDMFPEATIQVVAHSNGCNVSVKRSYDFVEVNFSKLMKIAKFFNTQSVDVDEWSKDGCPTCDWGSSYTKSFQIREIGSWNGKI